MNIVNDSCCFQTNAFRLQRRPSLADQIRESVGSPIRGAGVPFHVMEASPRLQVCLLLQSIRFVYVLVTFQTRCFPSGNTSI